MKNYERVELLISAEEELMNAIRHIAAAVKGSAEQSRAEAYILPHLRSWLNDRMQPTSIRKLVEIFSEDLDDEGPSNPHNKESI